MQMRVNKIATKAMCVICRNGNEALATLGYDSVKNENFARIIGGGVEFGETAESALRREFKEELGAELENLTFLKTIENVFTYNGQPGHEIIFLFKGDLADKSLYEKEEMKILDDQNTVAKWIPCVETGENCIKIYPEVDYEKILTN